MAVEAMLGEEEGQFSMVEEGTLDEAQALFWQRSFEAEGFKREDWLRPLKEVGEEGARGEDVTSINDRNKFFNKKIKRAFDKYTVEIRQNLERGTAL